MRYPRHDIQFSPDGANLFGPLDKEPAAVSRWDTATGAVGQTCRGHHVPVLSTAVSGDGRRLATHAASASVKETWVWDVASGIPVRQFADESIIGMALSSDGRKLVGVNRGGDLIAWDVDEGRECWRTHAHGSAEDSAAGRVVVFGVAFSRDDQSVATAGFRDGLVRVWRADTGVPLTEPLTGRPSLTGVAFSPDGLRVAAAGYDSEVRMWDVHTGQLDIVLAPPTGPRPADIAYTARPIFSQLNQRLALLDWRGYVGCWDGNATGN